MNTFRVVQNWTEHQPTDLERLDANVVYMRVRAWERADREIRWHNRKENFKTAGWMLLAASVVVLILWVL